MLKVAVFCLTCDEGCSISFLESIGKLWKKIQFKRFRLLQKREEFEDIDVGFVEGAVSTPVELEHLKQIRSRCKRLIALGNCAINGSPSNLRNFFAEPEQAEIAPILRRFGHLPKVLAPAELVRFDGQIPGCPVAESAVATALEAELEHASRL